MSKSSLSTSESIAEDLEETYKREGPTSVTGNENTVVYCSNRPLYSFSTYAHYFLDT